MAKITPQAQELAEWLRAAQRLVVFTGAGLSTESGIPDFRSPGGVWTKYQPVYFREFLHDPQARWDYWRQKSEAHAAFAAAQPNAGHNVLARWEDAGRLVAVITQNIDGLHQLAGQRTVWELHGTARVIGCLDCSARFPADGLVADFLRTQQTPACEKCGGRLKHATISFGQNLDPDVLDAAARLAQTCDLFLALGSSLQVHPAASLPEVAKDCGARLAIINRDPTPLDARADAVWNAPLGEALTWLDAQLSTPAQNENVS